MDIARKTALKVIYWAVVFAVTIVCLGAAACIRHLHRFDTLIVRVAIEHDVDPRLVASVIWKESRFNPKRTGKAGEIGLMQVMPGTGTEWAIAHDVETFRKGDLFDPEINVQAGTWYLARALRKWEAETDDPVPYALAEYNAGPSNARRWAKKAGADSQAFWESITYPTTKRYVRDVLKRYRGGV